MDTAPFALIMNRKAVEYADSGRPDSPVVEDRAHRTWTRRPHAVRTRTAAAALLRRTADAVTPRTAPCDDPSTVARGAW